MNHLGHALPWNALNASFIRDERDPNREERFKGLLLKEQDDGGLAAFKHVMHFSRCLHTKVEEFRATEKWRDVQEVERQRFDHTTWGNFKNMWCMPEAMSTLCGYINLNMLLLDEQKWRPLLSERYTAAIQEMSGLSDRGHPDEPAGMEGIRVCMYKGIRESGKLITPPFGSRPPRRTSWYGAYKGIHV